MTALVPPTLNLSESQLELDSVNKNRKSYMGVSIPFTVEQPLWDAVKRTSGMNRVRIYSTVKR